MGLRIITFKAEEDLAEALDSIARYKGVTRSEVIRMALELYIRLETAKRAAAEPRRVRLMC